VLVETEAGPTHRRSARRFGTSRPAPATITAVDTVTGPFDVIVQLEADDLDQLDKAIMQYLQTLDGVQRTTTCLSANL